MRVTAQAFVIELKLCLAVVTTQPDLENTRKATDDFREQGTSVAEPGRTLPSAVRVTEFDRPWAGVHISRKES